MTSAIVHKYKLTTELCVCNCLGHFIWFIAPEKIIIEKSGWGYNIYFFLKLNFLLLENLLKTSFCTYTSINALLKNLIKKKVHKYVFNFLMDHEVLTTLQSGFISGDSTVNQLVDIYNSFCKALDEGKEVRAIF